MVLYRLILGPYPATFLLDELELCNEPRLPARTLYHVPGPWGYRPRPAKRLRWLSMKGSHWIDVTSVAIGDALSTPPL